jgi:hypothetical protein
MKRAEDLLCEHVSFGYGYTAQNSHLHIPTLWEIAHDLEEYIKQGILIEIPINCSLTEIFEAENLLNRKDRPYHRLLELDYFGQDMKIQFKTVLGNSVYELVFSKSERSALNGYFKK